MDDCFLKNGNPEKQAARACCCARQIRYRIPPGRIPRQGRRSWNCRSSMLRLPTSSLFSLFTKSIPPNARSIKNGGQPWAVRQVSPACFCGACRRAPKRIAFSALRAGDGRHPVHAADAYGMNAPPLFADPGGLAAAMPSDSAPRRECKIPYGKCRKGFYVYFSHHYSHQKNKAEKEDLSTLFLLRSDASILCSAVIQTRLCSATQAWPTSPTHYPVPTG